MHWIHYPFQYVRFARFLTHRKLNFKSRKFLKKHVFFSWRDLLHDFSMIWSHQGGAIFEAFHDLAEWTDELILLIVKCADSVGAVE